MFSFIKYLVLFLVSINIYAQNNIDFCVNEFDQFPVQAGGRVKTYYVLAKETTKLLTGKANYNDIDASKLFCMMSLSSLKKLDFEILTPIDHIEIKTFLGLENSTHMIPLSEVASKKDLIRSEILKIKEESSYKKALNKLYNKISLYEATIDGSLWTYAASMDNQLHWLPISHLLTRDDKLETLEKSKNLFENSHGTTYLIENTLFKSQIFSIAMLIAILGIIVTVLFKNLLFGQIFAILTLSTEIIGITMRVLISGRAPITNMYETVMFSGFGALFIALIITIFKRDKIYILGGLGYNILCLFMMKFAGNMLDESISPLVPVLRDNFWLSTHVTTIMLSYAALALSWMLANFTLIKGRWGSLTSKDYKYYEELVYTCIKVGIILLSAGIILGGVWADYSWGRFWGWDPKETWSLIVLLFYMAMLHGKTTNWMTTHRFISLAATGFLSVMMAWFGVNYILATGLHSYGFSEGGAIFLGSFFAIQFVILALTTFKNPLITK